MKDGKGRNVRVQSENHLEVYKLWVAVNEPGTQAGLGA
jgi:hypothetical protein